MNQDKVKVKVKVTDLMTLTFNTYDHWPNDLKIGSFAQRLQNMTCVLAQPNDLDRWLNDLHIT